MMYNALVTSGLEKHLAKNFTSLKVARAFAITALICLDIVSLVSYGTVFRYNFGPTEPIPEKFVSA